jgi:hypothetical protein
LWEYAPTHPPAGVLVAKGLGPSLLEGRERRVEMPEGRVDESHRPGTGHRHVELVREPQEPLVGLDETQLIIARPGRLVEERRRAGKEPATGDPAMGDVAIADQLRQRANEGGAGDLVVVDVEDPVASAAAEQPREGPVDGLGVREQEDAVGDRRERVGGIGSTVVERDDDLVCNGAKE